MNETHGIDDTGTGGSGDLDPRAAADLLEQTRRRAERRFDPRSPWVSLLGAAVVLLTFGVLWLSVRGQHPYEGPTAASLAFMYLVLAAWIGVVAIVTRRATAGVSGRSIRQQRAYGAAVLIALVAVSLLQAALKYHGASKGIVYGIYPPTAQLTVLGTLGAAIAAGREDWLGFGVGIAVALVAAGSAFAGPAGVWLSDGIGLCAVVLGYSAAQAWLRRHEPRRHDSRHHDPRNHDPRRA
jgi:hypothetical protein